MRVEWIESKGLRSELGGPTRKLATQIPVSVERILQDFHPASLAMCHWKALILLLFKHKLLYDSGL
jgi:hypothetical protein